MAVYFALNIRSFNLRITIISSLITDIYVTSCICFSGEKFERKFREILKDQQAKKFVRILTFDSMKINLLYSDGLASAANYQSVDWNQGF